MGLLCKLGCRLHKVYLPGTLDLVHIGLVLNRLIFIGLTGVKMFPVDPGQYSNFSSKSRPGICQYLEALWEPDCSNRPRQCWECIELPSWGCGMHFLIASWCWGLGCERSLLSSTESAPWATLGGLLLSFLGTNGWAIHRRLSDWVMESHGMKRGPLPCPIACMCWDVVVSSHLIHRSPDGWSPKIKSSGRRTKHMLSQWIYMNCSVAPRTQLKTGLWVVQPGCRGSEDYWGSSILGNATGFMVKPSWKDGTVDGVSPVTRMRSSSVSMLCSICVSPACTLGILPPKPWNRLFLFLDPILLEYMRHFFFLPVILLMPAPSFPLDRLCDKKTKLSIPVME